MKKQVYVVGEATNYANWLNFDITDDIKKADLVLFTGGEDVHPNVYNEPKGNYTYTNLSRDLDEIIIFKQAKELGIKCLGICRGAQLMCALAGGRLVQHQQNNSYIHQMNTEDGVIIVNSTHHQAQYPYNLSEDKYKIIGWTEGLSKFHLNGGNAEISDNPFKECEIVYYKNTDSLGIQPHPEMLYGDKTYDKTMQYFKELLNKFINNEL